MSDQVQFMGHEDDSKRMQEEQDKQNEVFMQNVRKFTSVILPGIDSKTDSQTSLT